MSADSEIAPETIAAIGLALLLEAHEGAGPHGKISYVALQQNELCAEDWELIAQGFSELPEIE